MQHSVLLPLIHHCQAVRLSSARLGNAGKVGGGNRQESELRAQQPGCGCGHLAGCHQASLWHCRASFRGAQRRDAPGDSCPQLSQCHLLARQSRACHLLPANEEVRRTRTFVQASTQCHRFPSISRALKEPKGTTRLAVPSPLTAPSFLPHQAITSSFCSRSCEVSRSCCPGLIRRRS